MHNVPKYCQTHLKNLIANARRFLSVSDHFGTLFIKGFSPVSQNLNY